MTASTRLRIAGTADAAAVERVLLASYPPLMGEVYDETLLARALPMMTRANPGLLASGTYYLAEIDGEPVGCGGWTYEEPGTSNVVLGLAHVRHFAVAVGWTGRGIGRALYARCEAEAREFGAQRFECFASLNGEAFYAALGFVAIGPLNVRMGPQVALPSIRMTRTI